MVTIQEVDDYLEQTTVQLVSERLDFSVSDEKEWPILFCICFIEEACDIIIKKMILSQSNNINEYNTLINNLNPMGRYQIIIYAIGVVYWMIAGILKTIFDLTYYEFQCPYATALFECFGILLAGHIACWQNRKIALIAMGIISLLGYSMILITCLMISSVPSIRSFGTMGIALIGCSTYSQPLLALCIIC